MADAIIPILKKLVSEIHDYNNSLTSDLSTKSHYHTTRICDSFNVLLAHFYSVMLDYENEEVVELVFEMKNELDRINKVHPKRPLLLDGMIMRNCDKILDIINGSYEDGEHIVVGFDDEVETLLDQLTATCTKQVQVLSIAGMAGLGKTTLARKLYNDPLIKSTFAFRVWICVSQIYSKRDLLLSILSSFFNLITKEFHKKSDEQLGEKIYRLLKGHKYLVVFDDIWDCNTWNDVRIYFPDENVGSRVLFTSRDIELSLHVSAAKPAHVLRLRTEAESWEIFVKKVFRHGVRPPLLEEHVRVIISKGLPLAIVTTARLLQNIFTEAEWQQIAESQLMDSIVLMESSMNNSVTPFLKKLLSCIHAYNSLKGDDQSSEKILDESRIALLTSFDELMFRLRNKMWGCKNQEVRVLFKELKEELSSVLHTSSFCDVTIVKSCEKLIEIRNGSNIEGEETIVGFDNEVETLLDQLTTTCTKRLQVLSIAGMAGLGKTTLARKLYMDPLIEYMFDFRAWICVSQTYSKRDLLLGILSSFINDITEETHKMSNEQLGEKLYQLLKRRKYLVVLDDIWECASWNNLRVYFPDDNVGSRVLFTSRDTELSLHVPAAKLAHVLRLRTEDESWAIFLKKVFKSGVCPPSLEEHGHVIIKKCEGLPLAIVITAGLLKNNWSDTMWLQISESLHSFMVRDPSQYMDSLEISYNHLPHHLRQCFVFVGVFPEDYDIPVTKLIWLWIAQGFIHETETKTLEDVAKGFLMDLIKRSLLMTVKKRADGDIKTCRIHDLLRDLCLKKAHEEASSQQVYMDAHASTSSRTITNPTSPNFPKIQSIKNHFKSLYLKSFLLLHHYLSQVFSMSINPSALPSSDFLYPFEFGQILQKGKSFDTEPYKTLTILDVESILISLFPSDITQLVNLRYLAIQAHDGSPKASISSFVNLQMLIISSKKNIVVPKTIWSMVNLRHLYIKTGENLIEDPCFVQETQKDNSSSGLASLQTLSQVSPQSCQNILLATPNLRKLGFCGPLVSSQGELEFPNTRSLQHLQKLKLLNTVQYRKPTRLLNTMMFPEHLKKLTLSNTCMDWEDLWTVSLLSNLEILKLKFHACIGETWDTSDAEFKHLKILKLHGLNLEQWVCCRENFPGLKRLVVRQCVNLNVIPSELGKIYTLEAIEVQWCSNLAQVSALKIQEEHESEGNFFLKVHASNNH